ncbi:hypothetical protein [Endothiovibrio diazotrophicus]
MDIASVQGSNLFSQMGVPRGSNGPLGEQPNEVSQALAAPPQTVAPPPGGVVATAESGNPGGDGNGRGDGDRDDGSSQGYGAGTYGAGGASAGQSLPGGLLDVTA